MNYACSSENSQRTLSNGIILQRDREKSGFNAETKQQTEIKGQIKMYTTLKKNKRGPSETCSQDCCSSIYIPGKVLRLRGIASPYFPALAFTTLKNTQCGTIKLVVNN